MKKVLTLLFVLVLVGCGSLDAATRYYMDYETGSDTDNGSTWGLAFKTLNKTSSMAAGDSLLIAKSPDPVSIGNVTWTNNFATLILASALTSEIDDCENAWTAGSQGNVTVTADGVIEKEGSYATKCVIASGFTTGIVAFRNITPADYSSYDSITFWIFVNSNLTAGTFRLDLYSDDDTTSLSDSLIIDVLLESNRWIPWTIANPGGALGSSINCIALLARIDPGSQTVYLDNINASNSFTVQSLIGKNTSGEGFYSIKNIVGTTVFLGNRGSDNTDSSKYPGGTETVTTYRRETIKTTMAASPTTVIQELKAPTGTPSARKYILGGWNTSSSVRDGETWFDGLCGDGYGLVSNDDNIDYCSLDRIGLVRYYWGISFNDAQYYRLTNISCIDNNLYGAYLQDNTVGSLWWNSFFLQNGVAGMTFYQDSHNHRLQSCYFESNNSGAVLTYYTGATGICFDSVYARSNNGTGLVFQNSFDDTVMNSTITDNEDYAIDNQNSIVWCHNTNFGTDSVRINRTDPYSVNSVVRSHRHNQTADRWKSYHYYGTMMDQLTAGEDANWAYGGSGICLYMNPAQTVNPLIFHFKVPVTASTAFTVSLYVKKTNSAHNPTLTFSAGGSGVTVITDASVTLTDTWAQYTSSSMTPTENGFVDCFLKAKDGSTTGDIGIDNISVSAGATCDLGTFDRVYWTMMDGGMHGTESGGMNRWSWGIPDGGICDNTDAPPVSEKYLRIRK